MINPRFDECWLEECYISRNSYAQAICTVGFAELAPELESPLPGLLITDSSRFCPEDRTVSAAIRVGRQAAGLISVG